MKNKKLKLKNLEIKSFITDADEKDLSADKILGGSGNTWCHCYTQWRCTQKFNCGGETEAPYC